MTQLSTAFLAHIARWENLLAAWKKVKRNKGQGGVDGMTLEQFEQRRDDHLKEIQRALLEGRYHPQPVKIVEVPKRSSGNTRQIGIPTIRDRIVQQAILIAVEPLFEQRFLPCSYGFRPGRSAHQAIQAVDQSLAQGDHWIVEADIQDCFGTLDWALLLKVLQEKLDEPHVLDLLRRFLAAGMVRNGGRESTGKGISQGSVLSPLFANVYLHRFDRAMTQAGYHLIRYADDFLLLTRSRKEAAKALQFMITIIEGSLKLTLNREKTRILDARQTFFDFLGFHFHHGWKGPTRAAVEEFKRNVKAVLSHAHVQKPGELVAQVNALIRGWGHYFKIGEVRELYQQLDVWVKRVMNNGHGVPHPALVSLQTLR